MALDIKNETEIKIEKNATEGKEFLPDTYQVDSSLATGSTAATTLTTSSIQSISSRDAIDVLLKRSGYPLVQENGQRKYGPPPNWPNAEPDRSCEVFIGKIPRDCFEDELVPLMERVGFLYEFRLMMEYSGYNRGYGFAMFTSRENAKKAVDELNNYEIRKGRTIGVCRSVDNCRLFVGGIPKTKKKEEILDEVRKVTDDVINIIVYPSAHDKTKNRGFAFVQYSNHRAAAIARRKLIQNKIQLFEQPIAVDWAEPEPEVDETVMAAVKVLYVRNLMLSTSEEQIKLEFEKLKEGSVERVKKMKDFAFVHFKERDDALNALNKMNGATVDGAIIECSLSKPAETKNSTLFRLTKNALSTANVTAAAGQLLDINLLLNPVLGMSYLDPSVSPSAAASSTISAPLSAFVAPAAATNTTNTTQHQIHTPYASLLQLPGGTAYFTSGGYDLSGFVTATNMQVQATMPTPPQHQQQPHLATGYTATKINSRTGRVMNNGNTRAGLYRSNYNNNFVRGVSAGTVKKQASSHNVPYDLYSGVNPVPLLSMNQKAIKYGNSLANQILEDICLKENFGSPVYTLHTTTGIDSEGKEIGLFTYKVTIPALFSGAQICSNKLAKTIDEAKTEAAEYALMQIFTTPAQPYVDLNDFYFNYLQQKVQTIPQPQSQPPSQLVNTTPSLTPPASAGPANLIYPADTLTQLNNHEFQTILAATNQNANVATAATNETLLKNSAVASWQLAQQQHQHQQINPNEYFQHVVTPKYILDPSGKYLLCQAPGWQ